MTLRIERYGKSRYWAIYDGPELVVVTLYKRGAQEVLRRLAAQPRATAEAAAEEAAQEAAARQAQALAAQARTLARHRARLAAATSGSAPAPARCSPPAPRRDQREHHRRLAAPLVAIPGARSHPAEARQLRLPPHPATRGSSAPRACLGPRRSGVLTPPHPRRPARDCGARGFGGSAPMIPSNGLAASQSRNGNPARRCISAALTWRR